MFNDTAIYKKWSFDNKFKLVKALDNSKGWSPWFYPEDIIWDEHQNYKQITPEEAFLELL